MVNIFVYGTLKKGEPNHWLIKKLKNHARFLSVAETRDKLPLVIDNDKPVLLNRPGSEGGHQIQGQVYAVDEPAIAVLDRFLSQLERTKVHVVLLNKFLARDCTIDCYCYMGTTSSSTSDFIATYSSSDYTYHQEHQKRDLELGSQLIGAFIGDERLPRHIKRPCAFTDDSSDRQDSTE